MLLTRIKAMARPNSLAGLAAPSQHFASHAKNVQLSKLQAVPGKTGTDFDCSKFKSATFSKGKVEAWPFKLDPWSAMHSAKGYADNEVAEFSELKYPHKPEMESCEAVYLPYWLIDASFKLKSTGSSAEEPAEVSFTSICSLMPGFDVQPLRSLPLVIPPREDAGSQEVFTPALLDGPIVALKGRLAGDEGSELPLMLREVPLGESALGGEYTPELAKQLASRWSDNVQAPTKATVVPFAVSPLALPALLDDLKVDVVKTHSVDSVRHFFSGESLIFDMLAVYPVLSPCYVVKFKPQMGADGEVLPGIIVAVDAAVGE